MKILVALKLILSDESTVYFDQKQGLVFQKSSWMINPYDEYALEEALRLKDKYPDIKITTITVGKEIARQAIETSFEYSVDEGIHVVVNKELDPLQTASLLARNINNYDLLLFGRMALDDQAEMVGPLVAHNVGLPQITSANKVELNNDGKAIVHRRINGMKEIMEVELPSLITMGPGDKELRYPKHRNRLLARNKAIKRIEIENNQIINSNIKVVRVSAPKPLKKDNIDWMSLSCNEKIDWVMSGGIQAEQRGEMFEGTADEISGKIFEFLVDKKFA